MAEKRRCGTCRFWRAGPPKEPWEGTDAGWCSCFKNPFAGGSTGARSTRADDCHFYKPKEATPDE